MSTSSDSSSIVSDTSSDSIFNELDGLLQRCEQLHDHIHNSTETLHAIHRLVEAGGNIKITFNNVTRDFDELLEELHVAALERVRAGAQSNFGYALLEVLGKAQME
jgi:hypothetical protein